MSYTFPYMKKLSMQELRDRAAGPRPDGAAARAKWYWAKKEIIKRRKSNGR